MSFKAVKTIDLATKQEVETEYSALSATEKRFHRKNKKVTTLKSNIDRVALRWSA
jgi:hypothetical protein